MNSGCSELCQSFVRRQVRERLSRDSESNPRGLQLRPGSLWVVVFVNDFGQLALALAILVWGVAWTCVSLDCAFCLAA